MLSLLQQLMRTTMSPTKINHVPGAIILMLPKHHLFNKGKINRKSNTVSLSESRHQSSILCDKIINEWKGK